MMGNLFPKQINNQKPITYKEVYQNYEITEETATSPARVIAQVEDYTDLEGADFSCANLKAANLRGADLRGAEGLPEIKLTLTQQIWKNMKSENTKKAITHNLQGGIK